MRYLLMAIGLCWGAAPLLAQTRSPLPPLSTASPTAGATSPEARVNQYFTDLNQRLREVYAAPGDGRAIALLSTTITEFKARKQDLLPMVARLRRTHPTAGQPRAALAQEYAAILTSLSAAKMPARRQRNPALEYAFRHFDEARLTSLEPPKPAAN